MDTPQIRKHFDRHADEFDRLYSPERQSRIERLLNRHFRTDIIGRYLATLEHVRKSGAQSVLDVGCGPGHYLEALAEMGTPRSVGIDVSENMIALARANPAVGGNPSVELIGCDYSTWKSTETFDVVIAMGFFDYVSNPIDLLAKMRRQANHSVVASFPSRHWFRTPFRWVRRQLQGTDVYFYTPDEIRRLSKAAGFGDVTIEKLPGSGMNLVASFTIA